MTEPEPASPRAGLRRILPRVLIVLVLLSLLFAARCGRRRPAEDGPVVGSGTVEAEEIHVAAETAGRIARLAVDEGDRVKAGDVIAELDRDTLEAAVEQADAALFTAKMHLAEIERGPRREEIRARAAALEQALATLAGARAAERTARAAYGRPTELAEALDAAETQRRVAEASRREAEARVAEAQHGARPQELDAARAAAGAAAEAVAAAEAAEAAATARLEGARAELREAERADAERQAADTQVAAARTQLEVAEANLAAAQARRDLVEAGPRPDQRARVEQQRARAQAELTLASQDLERAQTLYDRGAVARKTLDAALSRRDQASAALREAEAALRDLDAGAREQERREASAAVAQATAAVSGARTALANAEREQAILSAGSRQQLERARAAFAQRQEESRQAAAAVAQARQQRAQAEANLALLEAGTRQERVRQAEAAAEAAAAGVAGAGRKVEHRRQALDDRFAARAQLEAAEQQVAVARAAVDAARAQLDLVLAGATPEVRQMTRGEVMQAEAARKLARSKLDDAVILAPRDGTISEVILRAGEAVTPGSTVVRMLDLERLWVRVYLPVRAATRVRLGQRAEVRADAFPNRTYPGQVIAVSDEAEFTPKNTQTVEERVKQVYWVKVGIGAGGGELKPGLPVDVVFATP